jgi:hypothetical protein
MQHQIPQTYNHFSLTALMALHQMAWGELARPNLGDPRHGTLA